MSDYVITVDAGRAESCVSLYRKSIPFAIELTKIHRWRNFHTAHDVVCGLVNLYRQQPDAEIMVQTGGIGQLVLAEFKAWVLASGGVSAAPDSMGPRKGGRNVEESQVTQRPPPLGRIA